MATYESNGMDSKVRMLTEVTCEPLEFRSVLDSNMQHSPQIKEINEARSAKEGDNLWIVSGFQHNGAPSFKGPSLAGLNRFVRVVYEHVLGQMHLFFKDGLGTYFFQNMKKIVNPDLEAFRKDWSAEDWEGGSGGSGTSPHAKELSKKIFGSGAYTLLAIRYIRKCHLEGRVIKLFESESASPQTFQPEPSTGSKSFLMQFVDSLNELIPEADRSFFYMDLLETTITWDGIVSGEPNVQGDPNKPGFDSIKYATERKGDRGITGIWPLNPFNYTMSRHRCYAISINIGPPVIWPLPDMDLPSMEYSVKAVLMDANTEEEMKIRKSKNPKNAYIRFLARKFGIDGDTGDGINFGKIFKLTNAEVWLVKYIAAAGHLKFGLALLEKETNYLNFYTLMKIGYVPKLEILNDLASMKAARIAIQKLQTGAEATLKAAGIDAVTTGDPDAIIKHGFPLFKAEEILMEELVKLHGKMTGTTEASAWSSTEKPALQLKYKGFPKTILESAPKHLSDVDREKEKQEFEEIQKKTIADIKTEMTKIVKVGEEKGLKPNQEDMQKLNLKQKKMKPSFGFDKESRTILAKTKSTILAEEAGALSWLMENAVVILPMYGGEVLYQVNHGTSTGSMSLRQFAEALQILRRKNEDVEEGAFISLKDAVTELHSDPIQMVPALIY